ncbi:unnamed protein product [Adineta ricciae]|uniref:Pentatricopeptide repeat-containing protein n=1 Tax=Adineta ricciae TaxID=249248 RepID=A0A815ELA2_ADIRI|nr:unnamed protein product [Adineta ricciae]
MWHSTSEIHRKDEYNIVAALDMFIKCGDISSVEQIFDRMKRIVVNYEQMMKYYNNHCMHPFFLVINSCVECGLEPRCRLITSRIPSSMLSDLKLQTTLIHMWGKVACVKEARYIFEKIDEPDSAMYNAMINVYGLNGMGYDAIQLDNRMPAKMGNDKIHVCVSNACFHSSLVNEYRSIFATIPNKNHYIYTTMVDCLSRSLFLNEAQQLIEEFERRQSPYLPIYKSFGDLEEASQPRLEMDQSVESCLNRNGAF